MWLNSSKKMDELVRYKQYVINLKTPYWEFPSNQSKPFFQIAPELLACYQRQSRVRWSIASSWSRVHFLKCRSKLYSRIIHRCAHLRRRSIRFRTGILLRAASSRQLLLTRLITIVSRLATQDIASLFQQFSSNAAVASCLSIKCVRSRVVQTYNGHKKSVCELMC